jgi:hypothetical protein
MSLSIDGIPLFVDRLNLYLESLSCLCRSVERSFSRCRSSESLSCLCRSTEFLSLSIDWSCCLFSNQLMLSLLFFCRSIERSSSLCRSTESIESLSQLLSTDLPLYPLIECVCCLWCVDRSLGLYCWSILYICCLLVDSYLVFFERWSSLFRVVCFSAQAPCTKVVDCQLMRVRESNSMGNALRSPTLQNSHCTEYCCQNNRWSITRP